MNVFAPNFTVNIAGIKIIAPIIYEWATMIFLIIASILLTRKMSTRNPSKIQTLIEMLYSFLEGLVVDNVGEEYSNFIPVLGTMFMMLFILDTSGMLGFKCNSRVYNNYFLYNAWKCYQKKWGKRIF